MTVWTKTGNSTWTKINSVFTKTGATTWTELLGVWVKTAASTWTKVFTRLSVPANTVAPEVTGSGYLYGTLSGTLGTWTAPNGTNSYARQWQSAASSGGSFGAISGATSSTFTTTASQDGRWVRLRVTATNASGSSEAFSNEVQITKYSPVALTTAGINGTATAGSTLTALTTVGTYWKNTTTITGDTAPDYFTYAWSQGDTGNPIGSNSSTYVIQNADINHTIRVQVTAHNTGGTSSSTSSATATVTAAATVPSAPTNVSASNITYSGARISWSAPSNNGGASITGYEVNRDGGTFFSVGNVSFYDYFISVAGTYSIGVRAVNTPGAGPAAFVSVTIPAQPPPAVPTITSGPFISWGSGNNYTLSASATGATNLEFQVQYSSSQTGSPSTGSATYFFGAGSGGGTTGNQAANRSWARTRVRANNSTTGQSSAFTGYTAYA